MKVFCVFQTPDQHSGVLSLPVMISQLLCVTNKLLGNILVAYSLHIFKKIYIILFLYLISFTKICPPRIADFFHALFMSLCLETRLVNGDQ